MSAGWTKTCAAEGAHVELGGDKIIDIRSGIWQHYSGKKYNVIGIIRHTETGEIGVAYSPLYEHPNGGPALQFRPIGMWQEEVDVSPLGSSVRVLVPRFKYIGAELPPAKG